MKACVLSSAGPDYMAKIPANNIPAHHLRDPTVRVMYREGLTDVLTNDRHFEQEGFRALFRA
jgi:hypothetical protein